MNEERIKYLEEEIDKIKKRNKKVEADKAWEVSLVRKLSITVMTYIATSLVFYFIGVENYLANALIPTLGYFLSTLTLPFIKKVWVKKLLSGKKN